MTQKTIYHPTEVKDQPIETYYDPPDTSNPGKGGVYKPQEIEQILPSVSNVAVETIGKALNTKERKILGDFTFGELGAFSIGKYVAGVSGEIKISPNGIIAKNAGGVVTFTLDGDSGDAYFKGTILAGSVVSGSMELGGLDDANGLLTIKDSANRVIIKADNLGHHYYNILGNELVKVDSTGFHAYNVTGTELYRITSDGFFGYGTDANVIRLRTTSSNTASYGLIGYHLYDSQFWFYITSGDSKNLHVSSEGKLLLVANTDAVLSGNDAYVFGDDDVFIDAGDKIYFNGSTSNDYMFYDSNDGVYRELDMVGDKTAILPTSEGYKALYCIESPEVWFMDFVEDREKLDPLFAEVTLPPYKFIKTDDGFQVWGKRRGKQNIRFENMTEEQFRNNDRFWLSAYSPAKNINFEAVKNAILEKKEAWKTRTKLVETKEPFTIKKTGLNKKGEKVVRMQEAFKAVLKEQPLTEEEIKYIDDQFISAETALESGILTDPNQLPDRNDFIKLADVRNGISTIIEKHSVNNSRVINSKLEIKNDRRTI